MRTPRGRIVLAVAALTLAVGTGVGTLPAVAQTTVTAGLPTSRWEPASAAQFDGLSGWLATLNDPTAGAGQAAPEYSYYREFGFNEGGEDFGHLSLDVVGDEKFASLVIVDVEEAREHAVRVLFPWTANSFYFLWVHRLAEGVWGAWVYDATPAEWTFIGAVLTSTRLAKLSSASVTGVAWTGPDQETCAAYPQAVVTQMASVNYDGVTPVPTQLVNRSNGIGDCPSTAAEFAPNWDYYVVGAAAPAAAAAVARSAPSGGGSAERRYAPEG